MLQGISGAGHVVITGGANSGPFISPSAPSAGMVRYLNSEFSVYDGSFWQQISISHATADLSSTANAAISWAITKMSEEEELKRLAQNNPAIKAAYDNMLRAADQLKTTIILSNDDKTTS